MKLRVRGLLTGSKKSCNQKLLFRVKQLFLSKYWHNTYIFSRSSSPAKAPFGMTLILVRTNLLKTEKTGWLFIIHNTGLRGSTVSTGEAFLTGTRMFSRLEASVSKHSCNVQRLRGTPTACPHQSYSTALDLLWSSSGEKASARSCNVPVCLSQKSRPAHRSFGARWEGTESFSSRPLFWEMLKRRMKQAVEPDRGELLTQDRKVVRACSCKTNLNLLHRLFKESATISCQCNFSTLYCFSQSLF